MQHQAFQDYESDNEPSYGIGDNIGVVLELYSNQVQSPKPVFDSEYRKELVVKSRRLSGEMFKEYCQEEIIPYVDIKPYESSYVYSAPCSPQPRFSSELLSCQMDQTLEKIREKATFTE